MYKIKAYVDKSILLLILTVMCHDFCFGQTDTSVTSLFTKRIQDKDTTFGVYWSDSFGFYTNYSKALINYSRLAMTAYEDSLPDSLNRVLALWQDKQEGFYGIEPAQRILLLWLLRVDSFSESSIDALFLNRLLDYRDMTMDNRFEYHPIEKPKKAAKRPGNPEAYVDSIFNEFTMLEAERLAETKTKNSLDYKLLRFYASDYDELLFPLYNRQLQSSRLDSLYMLFKHRPHFMGFGNIRMSVPLGNAAILNPHPMFGFGCGISYHKIESTVSLDFFISIPQKKILARNYSDSLTYARGFFGTQASWQTSISLFRSAYREGRLYGGFCFYGISNDTKALADGIADGIANAIDDDDSFTYDPGDEHDDVNPKAIDLSSFHPFVGFEYRKYKRLIRESYVGYFVETHFTHLDTHGGRNLSGPMIQCGIRLGGN